MKIILPYLLVIISFSTFAQIIAPYENPINVRLLKKEPLVVLDDRIVPYDTIQLLDPYQIEELLVFKNDSAVARYGSQAVNGCLILTTKKYALLQKRKKEQESEKIKP